MRFRAEEMLRITLMILLMSEGMHMGMHGGMGRPNGHSRMQGSSPWFQGVGADRRELYVDCSVPNAQRRILNALCELPVAGCRGPNAASISDGFASAAGPLLFRN